MSNKKRIAYYIIELVGFIAFILFTTWLNNYIQDIGRKTFELIPYLIFHMMYPIIFGALTRVPALISRRHLSHRFNLIRFLIVVVPGGFMIGQYIVGMIFSTRILFMFATDPMFTQLVGFWVGAVLIDCIKGKTNDMRESIGE